MSENNITEDGVDVKAALRERFAKLPKVVQNAILSADIEKQLRALAENHKLHLDQWSSLEDEVMLTLLGIESIDNLETNLRNDVGVSAEEAASLAGDISRIVFEPIRQELERELSHPEAQEKQVSAEEMAKNQAILSETTQTSDSTITQPPTAAATTTPPVAAPTVIPATPPQSKPTEKAVRAPLSSAYTARQPSTERKSVTGDPYRELPQ